MLDAIVVFDAFERLQHIFMHRLMRLFDAGVAGRTAEVFAALALVVPFAEAAAVMIAELGFQFTVKHGVVGVTLEHDVIQLDQAGEHFVGDLLVLRLDVMGIADHFLQNVAEIVQLLDGAGRLFRTLLARPDHHFAIVLQTFDIALHFCSRLLRAVGQIADFVSHHSETASMFARPRRFDGRIQRQQIGLLGNVLDQRHHFADLANRLIQFGRLLFTGFGLGFHLPDHRNDGIRVALHLIDHLAGAFIQLVDVVDGFDA